MEWEKLLSKERFVKQEYEKKDIYRNDYDTIICSTLFRRLQDKAQVFPLEEDDYVRTRLTHSLEVSAIGKRLGEYVFGQLKANEIVRTVVVVKGDGLNVRGQPDTESAILTQVASGEEMDYLETLDGWIKVAVDADEAYVSAEYVTVEEKLDTAITMTELLYGQGVSDVRVDLVEYAKQFVGNRYVWGGTSLTKGADCSGYVLSIFKKYGVSLPHSSVAQAGYGTTIKVSEAQPGDLIFYSNGRSINHVAIYIGGGQVIHASNPKTGIRISNVTYRSPVKAVRILHD